MIEAGITKVLNVAEESPDRVRYHSPSEDGWSPVRWGELADRSGHLALYLQAAGVGVGTKVGLFASTRVECAYAIHAIEACRAVFVPVYFNSTASQVQFVVGHADCEVLFTERASLHKVLDQIDGYDDVRQFVVFDGLPDDLPARHLERFVDFDRALAIGAERQKRTPTKVHEMVEGIDGADVAAIIYTSGTTGVPKGVMLTIDNLRASADDWYAVLHDVFPEQGDRRDILWLPVSHMAGWGILNQGTMFEYETWLSDPYRLLDILPEVRPTMLMSVPAYWDKLYSRAVASHDDVSEQHETLRRSTGGALQFLLSGGAGLDRKVKDFFFAAGLQIVEGYGLTECSPNLTMNRKNDYDFDSVGKPVPGVSLKLADDGEILVKGNNVFSAYYKNEEATTSTFDEDGWFRTGDLGSWTDRGFLKISGRKKEIIVTSGGKKIGPAGIEAQFVGRPYIEHVVLYGDEKKYLVAMVTVDPERVPAGADVEAAVRASVDAVNAELASYETIKKFFVHDGRLSVEAGHLTSSLKLRRKAVWAAYRNEFEALYES